jgi:hypothetical protein
MAETKTPTIWASLGQIALAAVSSYGMAKLADKETGWVPYRNQLVSGMAETALASVLAQFSKMQEQSQSNQQ